MPALPVTIAEMDSLTPILLCLFPFAFIGFFCGVLILLSKTGGWSRLAAQFPATGQPVGNRHILQNGRVGWVAYNNCLTIHTSPEGLHIRVPFPLRPGHPPLFLPWSALHNPVPRRILWLNMVEFEVGEPTIAKMRLPKKVFERVEALLDNPRVGD